MKIGREQETRRKAEKFKGKPMLGSDVSWCNNCNYPMVTFDMSCETSCTSHVEEHITKGTPEEDCPKDLETKCNKCLNNARFVLFEATTKKYVC